MANHHACRHPLSFLLRQRFFTTAKEKTLHGLAMQCLKYKRGCLSGHA